jgi:hypothetical protein
MTELLICAGNHFTEHTADIDDNDLWVDKPCRVQCN